MEISPQNLNVVTDEIPKHSSLSLENEFNAFLVSLAEKGEQYRNSNIIPKWIGKKSISLYIQILLTKYESTCTSIAQYTIYRKPKKINLTKRQIETTQNDIIKEIGNCIIKGNEKIIIFRLRILSDKPIGHANILIFRRKTNTIEHFEPYGFESIYKSNIKYVEKKLVKFIKKLNKYLLKNKWTNPIKLIESSQICPMVGPQTLERKSSFKKPDEKGFCAVWSLLLGELSLKFSDFTTKEIVDKLLKLFPTGDKLLFLITGYIAKTNLILEKNMEQILNKEISETDIYKISNINALSKIINVNQTPSVIFSPYSENKESFSRKRTSTQKHRLLKAERIQDISDSSSSFSQSPVTQKRSHSQSPVIRSTQKSNRVIRDSSSSQSPVIHSTTQKRNRVIRDSSSSSQSPVIRSTTRKHKRNRVIVDSSSSQSPAIQKRKRNRDSSSSQSTRKRRGVIMDSPSL
jgi:hypothetical protein